MQHAANDAATTARYWLTVRTGDAVADVTLVEAKVDRAHEQCHGDDATNDSTKTCRATRRPARQCQSKLQ